MNPMCLENYQQVQKLFRHKWLHTEKNPQNPDILVSKSKIPKILEIPNRLNLRNLREILLSEFQVYRNWSLINQFHLHFSSKNSGLDIDPCFFK